MVSQYKYSQSEPWPWPWPRPRKSESIHIQGLQYTFPDSIKFDDKLQYVELILDDANVSKLGGKMLIAFPDFNAAKEKDYEFTLCSIEVDKVGVIITDRDRPSPNNHSQRVIRGFLYTFPEDELKLVKIILRDALDNVSKFGGKMVIAFPDSIPAKDQVKDYGKTICILSNKYSKQKETGATSMFTNTEHWQSPSDIKKRLDLDEGKATTHVKSRIDMYENMATESASLPTPDAETCAEIVGLTVMDTEYVWLIREEFANAPHNHIPIISMVKLTVNETEALEVTNCGGPVTFTNYTVESCPDDACNTYDESAAIKFFRIQYDVDHNTTVTILVSFKVGLPIAARRFNGVYKLYAEIPPPSPNETPSTTRLLWLQRILSDSRNSNDFNSNNFKFEESGTNQNLVIRPANVNPARTTCVGGRISKASGSHAIIDNTDTVTSGSHAIINNTDTDTVFIVEKCCTYQ